MKHRDLTGRGLALLAGVVPAAGFAAVAAAQETAAPSAAGHGTGDFWGLMFVFVLASFIGLGIIRRVSRLLHTPLMSITNAISAIAVVGSIIVAGGDFPPSSAPWAASPCSRR